MLIDNREVQYGIIFDEETGMSLLEKKDIFVGPPPIILRFEVWSADFSKSRVDVQKKSMFLDIAKQDVKIEKTVEFRLVLR